MSDSFPIEDANSMLIRGGFIRQVYLEIRNKSPQVMLSFFFKAHSGLFQLLPLGLRIQEKIERLLDKHMTKIGVLEFVSSFFLFAD